MLTTRQRVDRLHELLLEKGVLSVYNLTYEFDTPLPRAYDLVRTVVVVYPDVYWDAENRLLYSKGKWDEEQKTLSNNIQVQLEIRRKKVLTSLASKICSFCAEQVPNMEYHLQSVHHIQKSEVEMATPVVA